MLPTRKFMATILYVTVIVVVASWVVLSVGLISYGLFGWPTVHLAEAIVVGVFLLYLLCAGILSATGQLINHAPE